MRIAAVGDSVNWGQGLPPPNNWNKMEDEKKYIFKCIEWLQKEEKVSKVDKADFLQHSGAIIGKESDSNKEPLLRFAQSQNKSVYNKYYGEIPDSYPTVIGQLRKLKDSKTIDLLFINGGPNDIGILSSASSDKTFQGALKAIDEFASSRVAVLLREASRLCPNALIIYTGYYPALSPESSIPLVGSGLIDFNLVPSLAYLLYLFPQTWLIDLIKITQTPRIKRQGLIFHKRMLGKFREQIGIFNENRDSSSPTIIFSPSGFGALNAMWAKQEMVSSIGNDPSTNVTSYRKQLCEEVSGSISYFDNKTCESAYIGHPNKRGANTYFKALKKRIEHQLHFSLRKHLEIIDKDIMSIRELKNRYKFIPIRSIRNLTDVLWLDSISINYTISISGLNQSILKDRYGHLTTDIPADAANQGPRRFDDPLLNSEIMPLLEMFPKSTVIFDFGRSKALVGVMKFDNKSNLKDNFVIDSRGHTSVKKLRYVRIRLPSYYEFLTFSMQFDIRVNGYKFQKLLLSERSFSKTRNDRTSATEFLIYKKSLLYFT